MSSLIWADCRCSPSWKNQKPGNKITAGFLTAHSLFTLIKMDIGYLCFDWNTKHQGIGSTLLMNVSHSVWITQSEGDFTQTSGARTGPWCCLNWPRKWGVKNTLESWSVVVIGSQNYWIIWINIFHDDGFCHLSGIKTQRYWVAFSGMRDSYLHKPPDWGWCFVPADWIRDKINSAEVQSGCQRTQWAEKQDFIIISCAQTELCWH